MKTCPACQHTYSDDVEFCPHDGARLAAQATETEAQLTAGLSRRFRIVRRLGKGAMGTVFFAEQIGVGNRPVALKVLNRKLLDDPEFLMRFQNEAGSTGRIHHQNVVTIYESGQADDGTPYIAMEFLEGESLREALQRRGALPVTEVAEILQQAARGLNAAHKLGIIHRDLKPDNIFLTHSDEGELVVKVVDFGIAKLRESATHTLTGTVLGTPAYMSYEQASGIRSDELDARSDIYSLGVVVYEMLTGRVPFHSDTPVGYLRKHMLEEPPPFRAVKPGPPVPPRIESVVMKALTKDRNQRYTSVLEFAQGFAQAAALSAPAADVSQPLPSTKVVESPAVGEPDAPVPLPVTAQAKPQREAVKPQPQTAATPAPKIIVPAPVGGTVAAKAVPETARPLRRKWLWSRWKRIGIVASIVWVLGAGICTLSVETDKSIQIGVMLEKGCIDAHNGQETPFYECDKLAKGTLEERLPGDRIAAAIVAFLPVPLGWGFIYLVLFLVRWIRVPAAVGDTVAAKAVPETAHLSRRKWLVIGSLIFLILATAGGFWLYSSYRQRPDFTKETRDAQATSSQDTYVITAHTIAPVADSNLRDDLYTIVHGKETLKVQYAQSQTSSAKPGDFPGTGLHLHQRYSNPDLSQVPALGVAVRACLMVKHEERPDELFVAIQPTPAPCMARIGNELHYVPSPNGPELFTYVNFDILAETTGQ